MTLGLCNTQDFTGELLPVFGIIGVKNGGFIFILNRPCLLMQKIAYNYTTYSDLSTILIIRMMLCNGRSYQPLDCIYRTCGLPLSDQRRNRVSLISAVKKAHKRIRYEINKSYDIRLRNRTSGGARGQQGCPRRLSDTSRSDLFQSVSLFSDTTGSLQYFCNC
jgi:hypothetical protein